MHSLRDELEYFFSGKGMPYAKVSLVVAIVVSVVFTAVFSDNYIKDGKVAVIDLDKSRFSREFIGELDASPYIKVADVLNVPTDPATLFYKDRYLAVVYLPEGFEKNSYGRTANGIGVFYDNTNAAQNGWIRGVLNSVIAVRNQKIGRAQIQALGVDGGQSAAVMSNISLGERLLFNPTGSFSNSTVIGFLFFFPSMFFVFATIGMVPRLRLEGKWEALLLDGGPLDVLLRLVPYIACLTVSLVVGLGILRTMGDMVFAGNIFTLLLAILILSVSVGIMSLLFGWGAANPGLAGGRMILFLPGGWILGGVTTPAAILPGWVHVAFNVFPLVWGYRFTRDIILRGASFADIADTFGWFMIYTGVLAALLYLRFYHDRRVLLRSRQAVVPEGGAAVPHGQPFPESPGVR